MPFFGAYNSNMNKNCMLFYLRLESRPLIGRTEILSLFLGVAGQCFIVINQPVSVHYVIGALVLKFGHSFLGYILHIYQNKIGLALKWIACLTFGVGIAS